MNVGIKPHRAHLLYMCMNEVSTSMRHTSVSASAATAVARTLHSSSSRPPGRIRTAQRCTFSKLEIRHVQDPAVSLPKWPEPSNQEHKHTTILLLYDHERSVLSAIYLLRNTCFVSKLSCHELRSPNTQALVLADQFRSFVTFSNAFVQVSLFACSSAFTQHLLSAQHAYIPVRPDVAE